MKPFLLFVILLLSVTISTGQEVKIATGQVVRFEHFPSQFVDARTIDVWVPDSYSPATSYAVVYMHDGQMLFDSSGTWNHQEWCVDEVAGELMREHQTRDFIVVGIWNNGAWRHVEYFPQKPFESLPGKQQDSLYPIFRSRDTILSAATIYSDHYLQFLVAELKPFIDSAFSTKPDQQNTFIAGSSMGGLISFYAICEYPEVFGGAACLSTHWTGTYTADNNPIPNAFLNYATTHLPDPETHKIYFDYGTLTLDSLYEPSQVRINSLMRERGYSSLNWVTRKFPGKDHSERSWAERLDIPLIFLLRQ